jgi:hypothetical protein
MNISEALRAKIASNQKLAVGVAVVGALACIGAAMTNPSIFYRGYLLGFMFWMNLTLGCLGLVMMHNLVGGDWGHASRRFLEAGMRTLPLMALLFILLIPGIPYLYEWANAEHVAHDHILQQKAFYLNQTAFLTRAAIYFAFWLLWMWMLHKRSVEFEKTPTLEIVKKAENISGPGAVLFFLITTGASYDWVMSLEPHWYSSIYGAFYVVCQGLVTLAFAIVMTRWFSNYEPFDELTVPKRFHDLGKLMHGFIVLWTYASFSQFLIIWSANIPEEIPWYLHRIRNGWQVVAIGLMIFHFFVPFFILLSQKLKRKKHLLVWVAAYMLVMRFVDLYWQTIPAFPPHEFHFHVFYILPAIAIGGAWFAAFFWLLQARPLLPLPDNSYEAVTGELEHA